MFDEAKEESVLIIPLPKCSSLYPKPMSNILCGERLFRVPGKER